MGRDVPLWRLAGVVAFFGGLGCLGYALGATGHADDAATVLVVTVAGTFMFWLNRKPKRLQTRLGPLGAHVPPLLDAKEKLDAFVRRRTVLAGLVVFACWGIVLVLATHLVVAALDSLASVWIAAALGATVGLVVVAPELWRQSVHRLRGVKPARPFGTHLRTPHSPGRG